MPRTQPPKIKDNIFNIYDKTFRTKLLGIVIKDENDWEKLKNNIPTVSEKTVVKEALKYLKDPNYLSSIYLYADVLKQETKWHSYNTSIKKEDLSYPDDYIHISVEEAIQKYNNTVTIPAF